MRCASATRTRARRQHLVAPLARVSQDRYGPRTGGENALQDGTRPAMQFPIKQGGLATQQADASASAMASRLGAPVTPQPCEPVLRGMLLTEDHPIWLRDEPAAQGE